jgi:hypothetical protein
MLTHTILCGNSVSRPFVATFSGGLESHTLSLCSMCGTLSFRIRFTNASTHRVSLMSHPYKGLQYSCIQTQGFWNNAPTWGIPLLLHPHKRMYLLLQPRIYKRLHTTIVVLYYCIQPRMSRHLVTILSPTATSLRQQYSGCIAQICLTTVSHLENTDTTPRFDTTVTHGRQVMHIYFHFFRGPNDDPKHQIFKELWDITG